MKIEDLLQSSEYKQKFVLEKFIQDALQISREEMWMQIDQELTTAESDLIIRNYNSYVVDKKPMEYIL